MRQRRSGRERRRERDGDSGKEGEKEREREGEREGEGTKEFAQRLFHWYNNVHDTVWRRLSLSQQTRVSRIISKSDFWLFWLI